MEHLGLGVSINILGGNEETVNNHKAMVGQKIKKLSMDDNRLNFEMESGDKFCIRDDGQSRCEHRYMTCDDNLSDFMGSEYIGAEIAEGGREEDEYGEPHDTQFLKVETSKGTFTCCTHNEHNGYYGGFWIVIEKGSNSNAGDQE